MAAKILKSGVIQTIGIALCFVMCCAGCSTVSDTLSSPDGKLSVRVELDEQGCPQYSIFLADRQVVRPSALGLVRSDQSFAEKMILEKVSAPQLITDRYTMPHGKRKECTYKANRQVFTLKNASGSVMEIVFQVSNDGAAFCYAFPEMSDKTYSVIEEKTAFAFAPDTQSWLHPMQPGKSGWEKTQPSYEEHYVVDGVGKPSPHGVGWCFPALFKTADEHWVLISDTDMDGSYCGTRLAHESAGGVYHIAFPHPEEHRGPQDPIAPQITLPFRSPWRVLIVGDTLKPLVESALITDVATPNQLPNTDFIKPGRASWHWLRYSDDSSTLETVERFLDFSAAMHWEYILVDCNWDRNIGYEKMAAFVQKARQKNVDVILWYNSNGDWNTAPMTPQNRMHTRQVRREEFARLQKMGVKGVKVDFFGGDKQATMQFYIDLFKDAADFGILVNVHGATLPRGWQRTYPNLITAEAVKGMEYVTFDQRNTDLQAQHCTILPFTRNVVSSMDFTPMVFNPRIRGVRLKTTPAFELALSVVFESGIQHFGLVPEEQQWMPDFVMDFLQQVPTAWDTTRFIDGFPGQFIALARKRGNIWYVAGINGTDLPRTLSIDLSFLGSGAWKGSLITDGPNRTFENTMLEEPAVKPHRVVLPARGGFVMVLKK